MVGASDPVTRCFLIGNESEALALSIIFAGRSFSLRLTPGLSSTTKSSEDNAQCNRFAFICSQIFF